MLRARAVQNYSEPASVFEVDEQVTEAAVTWVGVE